MKPESLYLQICVDAPDGGMSAKIVTEWTERVLEKRSLDWVAICDVDLTGDSLRKLRTSDEDVRVMQTGTLLDLIRKADHVDWAMFFFCESELQAKTILPEEKFAQSAEKSSIAVQIADTSWFYVTGKEKDMQGLEEVLPPGTVRVGSIDEMDFLY